MVPITQRVQDVIRREYRINFAREVSDEEASVIMKNLLPRMRKDLSQVEGYSEEKFNQYMTGPNTVLTFSPMCIINEVKHIVSDIGREQFEKQGKYKRAREMLIASKLCLAQRKLGGGLLSIQARDIPDIVLTKIAPGVPWWKRRFFAATSIEVLLVNEFVHPSLITDFDVKLAEFIAKKKFLHHYGQYTDLLIGLDINQGGINFDKVSQIIRGMNNNPYRRIFLIAITSTDAKVFTTFQLSPIFARVDFDFAKDSEMLY